MTVDIRAAAEAEAADKWQREAGKPWRRVFVSGAVWAQAQLTPTREQIADAIQNRPLGVSAADAVLALLQNQTEAESHGRS